MFQLTSIVLAQKTEQKTRLIIPKFVYIASDLGDGGTQFQMGWGTDQMCFSVKMGCQYITKQYRLQSTMNTNGTFPIFINSKYDWKQGVECGRFLFNSNAAVEWASNSKCNAKQKKIWKLLTQVFYVEVSH